MIATSCSVHVTLDDGQNKKTFVFDKPWKGLLVAPGLWCDLDNFSGGAVCIVLASEKYESVYYIHDYQEFIKLKGL